VQHAVSLAARLADWPIAARALACLEDVDVAHSARSNTVSMTTS